MVKRLIISREKSRGIRRCFASRNAASVTCRFAIERLSLVWKPVDTRNDRKISRVWRFFFFFFFWNEDFSILGDSFNRETVGVEAKRGETGNNEKMMALFKGMNVRRDFIAGNERILGGARLRDTLTGNSSGFYEYGVTVPLIITVWLHPGLKAPLKIVIQEFFLRASNFTAIFSSLFLLFCPSVSFFFFFYRFLDSVRRKGWGGEKRKRVEFLSFFPFRQLLPLSDPKSEADSSTEWMKETYSLYSPSFQTCSRGYRAPR